ncbi:uncharacterized protein AKAW2_31222A [Aspergillus luchuensis]|uniref:Uncharacterized protein n=1 Tax=Aspergillus kawachii TaxID=1069201 RepID=A0A7R7W7P3_ASPKA|nr:uncharacterized protein AKAW2_31222A [Aspergillus luchuensis]BCR97903.1 hypothetical protein AKAW2_31222A [Aspergillus luchuensis]
MELGMFSSLSSPDMITPSFNLPPRWFSICPVLCIASDCHLGSLFLPKTVVISSSNLRLFLFKTIASGADACSSFPVETVRDWYPWFLSIIYPVEFVPYIILHTLSFYHPHPLIWFIIISAFHSPIVRMQIHTYSHTEDISIYSLISLFFLLVSVRCDKAGSAYCV